MSAILQAQTCLCTLAAALYFEQSSCDELMEFKQLLWLNGGRWELSFCALSRLPVHQSVQNQGVGSSECSEYNIIYIPMGNKLVLLFRKGLRGKIKGWNSNEG